MKLFIHFIVVSAGLLVLGEAVDEGLRGSSLDGSRRGLTMNHECIPSSPEPFPPLCGNAVGPLWLECECAPTVGNVNRKDARTITHLSGAICTVTAASGKTFDYNGRDVTRYDNGRAVTRHDTAFSRTWHGTVLFPVYPGQTGLGNIQDGPTVVVHTGTLTLSLESGDVLQENGTTIDVCAELMAYR